ncbi:winged helix DNA-binding domain-containing protein [Modestobacter sp. VKM Ac-2986]|uniref:winged helix DNA-binding domain-containing protein n=1 Tax=Modestobacter sp. VKM Ac-2986 TaxID=3004140 RepID=UPI0022AB0FD4|nr:winged helix DNA-binding domain-containing protein [Modestobacter sp. VKM Ac-2986]MCZ2828664.1 winged helix DNA-binding domain-containing protein [Modestobacter sp. VKM Ac-2986]
MRQVTRADVLASRVRAHQLDRTAGTLADTAVLDLGVQDTGADAARWALAVRGLVDVPAGDLALVWTLRGAPHVYRRADLPGVAAATAPFSEADAAKRVFDGARPLRAAGVPVLTALDTMAAAMREVVTAPTVKGELSRQLTERMDAPYLRHCRPCHAVHVYEQTFRLAALRAGLELQPDTSPPVLQPVPGLVPAAEVPAHLDVVRGYLRLHGPATPQQVAAYLDAPVQDVRGHWPDDAVEVQVDGERRWLLAADVDGLGAGPARTTRLLGPFDPYLQTRDRTLLVPDAAQASDLWRVLGRPGAVLVDGEVAGTWRPRKAGRRLTVQVDPWRDVPVAALEAEAERLAAVRGTELAGLTVGG